MIPYIEDVYPLFYSLVNTFNPSMATTARQFKEICEEGRQFTDKQANYLLFIMKSHMNQVPVDLTAVVNNPKWKSSFRQVITDKRIWMVDHMVYFQFPYSVRASFEAEVCTSDMLWNSELKCRMASIFDINLIQLYDFGLRHGFEIDPVFEQIAFDAEDSLAEESKLSPYSTVIQKQVFIVNAPPEADAWFDEHKTGVIPKDIFIAKQMGYLYKNRPRNLLESICSMPETSFWMSDVDRFLNICNHIDGRVCIVLDRASNNYKWMADFIKAVKQSSFSLDSVKFGTPVKNDNPLHEMIINNGLNKDYKSGKITIFVYSPKRWFKDIADEVSLLVTNNLYPSTNAQTREWFDSHPCVIHLSEYCPTTQLWSNNIVKV